MGASQGFERPGCRGAVDECCELLKGQMGIDLREVMYGVGGEGGEGGGGGRDLQKLFFRGVGGSGKEEEGRRQLNQTWLGQPAVFVVEYALAGLLRRWGLEPQALMGYSVGEYVAATIAGVLSLGDGLRLVAERAKLIEKLPEGAMLAVAGSEGEVQGLLGEKLSIAICNGPRQTVVAGPEDAIGELEGRLAEKEMVNRRLPTRHAFHSRMMEAGYQEMVELMRGVELKAPKIAYISNVTGTWIKEEEARDVEYWAKHMCGTVRFGDGVGELLQGGEKVLVEVGPGQGLGSVVKQHGEYQKRTETVMVSTMKTVYSEEEDQEVLLGALGKLWLAGTEIDWGSYYGEEKRRRIALPTYPFERQSFWIETARTRRKELKSGRKPEIADWFYEPIWLEAQLAKTARRNAIPTKAHWLVFVDCCGIGSGLGGELKAVTKNITTVKVGPGFSKTGPNEYVIQPGELAHYKALIRELKESGAKLEHIVHLWSVTADGEQGFDELQKTGFYSLQFLAKALGENRITGALRLDIVSNHLYAVQAAEELCPEKATILGPCRVIPQEYPNITTRVIDIVEAQVSSGQQEQLLTNLLEEVTSDGFDVTVSYRGDRRLVQSFSALRLEEESEKEEVLRPGGVYLITGGLGAVGLVLAQMLTSRFGAKVVLTGRRAFPAKEEWGEWLAGHEPSDKVSAKIRCLQAMEQEGGEVMVVGGDVADEASMRKVFAAIDEHYGVLHGVLHAAGVPEADSQKVIQEITTAQSECHFHAKVHGTRVLARLLEERQIDFCMLFSSISVPLGGITLSAYAAGNAFLDTFAQHKNQAGGTRWVAVNWDTWKVGQQVEEQKYKGLETTLADFVMFPQEGAEAFRRIVSSTRASQVVNSTADLKSRLDQWIYRRHLREKKTAKRGGDSSHYARPNLSTSYQAVNTECEERVARVLQEELGIESVGLPDHN